MRAINRNKIIAVMSAIVVFMVSMCTYSGETKATNTDREYYVYDAQSPSEEPIRDYTLYAFDTYPNINNTRSLIGDNRYPDWSKSGVVKLRMPTICAGTGFVVDEHTIATAAHCVYTVETQTSKAINDILLFDASGNVEMIVTPVEMHVPELYVYGKGNREYDARYDYALITVEEDLSDYMCFNLGATLDNADEYDLDVKITGFPQKVTINNNDETVNNYLSHNMYTSEGTITDVTEMQIVSYHYTSPGNSGGPIYIEETRGSYTYCSVLGILSSGVSPDYVCTTRITTDLLHFYRNNPNLIYETEE